MAAATTVAVTRGTAASSNTTQDHSGYRQESLKHRGDGRRQEAISAVPLAGAAALGRGHVDRVGLRAVPGLEGEQHVVHAQFHAAGGNPVESPQGAPSAQDVLGTEVDQAVAWA